jgi:beta-glucanase (GH16 family)/transcriptional regulator with XRE-family HTH domain
MDVHLTADEEASAEIALLPAQRLGRLLCARREEACVEPLRAAQAAGIEISALDDIECGRRLPDAGILASLLKCYRVTPREFLPRREPLGMTRSNATSDEVLRDCVDAVRTWRKAGRKQKLTFRQTDVRALANMLGTDPDEVERRLIAITGCSPAEARLLRKWFLAAVVTIPLASPVLGAVAPARAAKTGRTSLVARAPAPKLIWHDEFKGAAGAQPNPKMWQAVTGGNGWGNNELEYYTARASNVSLDGAGHLAITARRETYTDSSGLTRSYTSARIQTKGLFQSTYGRIEARIKLPAGDGLWPAFWALGAAGSWPTAGEIDVMENIGSDPSKIYGSIHGPQAGSHGGYRLTAEEHSPVSLAAGFHTYGVDWSPKKIVFTLDGIPYATRTPASLSSSQGWVFNKPFYLLLNLAVGGTWPGSPKASTNFPVTMLVDWVRVYS